MNSVKTLLRNASVYTGANILNAGIPFLLLPVLTRVLSPTDYGTIAMFGIVVTIMGAFTGLSVHGAVGVRYFQLDRQRMPSYVGACLAILIVSSAVVLCVVAVGRPWLELITHVPGDWLIVAVLVSGAQFVINIRLSLWQVQHEAIRYGAVPDLPELAERRPFPVSDIGSRHGLGGQGDWAGSSGNRIHVDRVVSAPSPGGGIMAHEHE